MNVTISPIIQVAELIELYNSENLVLVDASFGKNARLNYDSKHLERAIFVDLNTQLADIKEDAAVGGRHPLPKIETFVQTVLHLGISEKSHVVIYDDDRSANAAARFWWMLKAIGHEKVQVLNGGIQEAEKHSLPVDSKKVDSKKAELYKAANWMLPMAGIDEVEKVSQSPDHLVVDVRDAFRYNGESEPIDLIAGHIPGALNISYTENLDKEGLFLKPEVLKRKFEEAFGDIQNENIIFHCGSGVTACHSLLAIAYAGLEIPKLYVGSWSEWSRNNKTIATGIKK